MTPTTAVAHLISVHAPHGSGEVIVTTSRDPDGEHIARYPLGAGGVEAGVEILRNGGWAVTSTWSRVERGYLVADVTR